MLEQSQTRRGRKEEGSEGGRERERMREPKSRGEEINTDSE